MVPQPPERETPAAAIRTGEAIDETLFVNLRQAFMLCSAFAKPLYASQGAIVNITSTAATGAGGTQGAYAASKGGLNTLTKNLANEWASKGVRVNAVAPGLVDTEMWEPTFDRLGEDTVRKNFVKSVPLGRWGTADEIADVACFLASDRASYVTGQVIRVDGTDTNKVKLKFAKVKSGETGSRGPPATFSRPALAPTTPRYGSRTAPAMCNACRSLG